MGSARDADLSMELSRAQSQCSWMGRHPKLLARILQGGADANIGFNDLCRLLRHLGFVERTASSHHIFTRPDIRELINLQESGTKAKPYQVRQVRAILMKYGLGAEPPEDAPE